MKRFKFFLSLVLTISVLAGQAQTDAKAKAILDKLSAKTKAYTSIKADFNYTLNNKSEDINETQAGSIAIKGEKYVLKIAGQEIRSDGNSIWTYLKDAEEVQITEVDEDNEDNITPTKIFTMYEKGYRHEYVKDETVNGVLTSIVNIYPLDLDDKSYHTVKLYINKAKTEITKIKILGKEGDIYTYKIKSFQPNVTISDGEFTFKASDYPGVEIIDLR